MSVARHFTQLTCWKLADALRREVLKFTTRPPFARDIKHRFQTEDAVDSICRNIAEGFGCKTHGEFAHYLRISRRSLNELKECLHSAQLKRYVAPGELSEAISLVRRLYPALNNFIAYLDRTPDPPGRGTNSAKRPRKDERRKSRPDKRKEDRSDDKKRDRTDDG